MNDVFPFNFRFTVQESDFLDGHLHISCLASIQVRKQEICMKGSLESIVYCGDFIFALMHKQWLVPVNSTHYNETGCYF